MNREFESRSSKGMRFIIFVCFLLLTGVEATERPNIILIMSDDMGYSDIGCYGGEIHTPNLDSLASNGIRFTQFYNAARCCPTRASLLTGLYPHQAGIGWMTNNENRNYAYDGELNSNCVTLAEVAKTAGYSTFMTGKWHVSRNSKAASPQHSWPLQRGFDRYYGILGGASNFFDPKGLCRDNRMINKLSDIEYSLEDYYFTDAISDEAVRFVRERDKEKPFFLYIAYTAAHWPMHAKPEDIATYKGRYDLGWETIRNERFARMKQLGVISRDAELSPLDTHPWESESRPDVQAGRMEVYAAMVDCMDQGIGRLAQTLRDEGIFENTLILYLQDNGGCAEEIGSKGPVRQKGKKETTRLGEPIMIGEAIIGGSENTYVSYGKSWANVSNTPFREYKHWVHEGGISTPLIVHYPDLVKHPNSIEAFPSHIIDVMPTLVELMCASYPKMFRDHHIHPMEGVSLVPIFSGESVEREHPLCWEHELNRAVRDGDWKLVSKGRLMDGPYRFWTNFKLGEWELYNIAEDRSELHDLALVHPERAEQMAKVWTTYAERVHVFPNPWKP